VLLEGRLVPPFSLTVSFDPWLLLCPGMPGWLDESGGSVHGVETGLGGLGGYGGVGQCGWLHVSTVTVMVEYAVMVMAGPGAVTVT